MNKRKNNFICEKDKKKKKIKYDEESSDSDNSESDEETLSECNEDELAVSYLISSEKTLKNTNKIAYNNLLVVKEQIEKTTPNLENILTQPMLTKDRAKICLMFEIYKNYIPYTDEWLNSRSKLNTEYNNAINEYKNYIKYPKRELKKMEQEEKKMVTINSDLEMKFKILNLVTSKENKKIIFNRYQEYKNMNSYDDEKNKLKHWLNWAIEIPHDNIKTSKHIKDKFSFIQKAKQKLDEKLFGMEKVKEKILLFISSKLYNPCLKQSNLALLGPPGTGKTSIARLIAEIMDWGFSQISLGGAEKTDYLKGHDYTYVGAQPGEIVKKLKYMKYKNGVIFFDEFDKVSKNSDIKASLLHLIDPSQNNEFRDNFTSPIKIDLSHIWFVASMNNLPDDSALADRWWVINVDGYSRKDKIEIIRDYIFPKYLKNFNLSNKVKIADETIVFLINKVSKDSDKGVRTLEKSVNDIVNKIHFLFKYQNKEGLLPFKTSFDISEKLKIPLQLDKKFITILVDAKINNNIDKDLLYSLYI